jgi:hypothetical protein
MNLSIGLVLINTFKEPIFRKAKELNEKYAFVIFPYLVTLKSRVFGNAPSF